MRRQHHCDEMRRSTYPETKLNGACFTLKCISAKGHSDNLDEQTMSQDAEIYSDSGYLSCLFEMRSVADELGHERSCGPHATPRVS